MDPRQAIQAFREQKIDNHALLRVLVSHDGWRMLAVKEEAGVRPLLRLVGEDRWLQAFTDEAAFQEHLEKGGESVQGHDWVETTGAWLFGNLRDGLAGLDINPLLEDGLHYKHAQFTSLREWAHALQVEKILETQDTSEEAARTVATAPFYIAFIDTEAGAQLALAPDPGQNRQFAAIFTAPDAALTYVRQAERALNRKLQQRKMPGHLLFRNLSQMPLDGLVFNCMGPTPPVAVSLEFANAFATQTPETPQS